MFAIPPYAPAPPSIGVSSGQMHPSATVGPLAPLSSRYRLPVHGGGTGGNSQAQQLFDGGQAPVMSTMMTMARGMKACDCYSCQFKVLCFISVWANSTATMSWLSPCHASELSIRPSGPQSAAEDVITQTQRLFFGGHENVMHVRMIMNTTCGIYDYVSACDTY